MLDIHPYFDIRHNYDGRVVSSTHPAALYRQGNSLILISVTG
jgi:hypothetical protein